MTKIVRNSSAMLKKNYEMLDGELFCKQFLHLTSLVFAKKERNFLSIQASFIKIIYIQSEIDHPNKAATLSTKNKKQTMRVLV